MLQLKDFLQLVSIKYLLTFFSDLTKQAKGQVPLIFRGIVGQDLKEEMSPSFFNIEEVVTVLEYIKEIASSYSVLLNLFIFVKLTDADKLSENFFSLSFLGRISTCSVTQS